MNNQLSLRAYFLTLFLAMSLNILLLPPFLKSLTPDWVLLVLIYWALAMPEKTGVFHAWGIGILVDVLTGRLLGQHALAYALISYVCLKFHRRLRQYPAPQQSLFVFFCLLFSQLLVFWIESMQGATKFTLVFWLPTIIGTLVWPLVYSILRYVRIFGHIN